MVRVWSYSETQRNRCPSWRIPGAAGVPVYTWKRIRRRIHVTSPALHQYIPSRFKHTGAVARVRDGGPG